MQDRRTADRADTGTSHHDDTDREEVRSREAKRRERFARALARSAFGRHYWDERMETELRDQMRQSRQRSRTK